MSSQRMMVARLAAVAVCVFVPSAFADPFDPVMSRTSAGQALARYVLLNPSDLGSAWTKSSLPTPSPSAIACPALQPDQSGLVETGIAGSSFDDGPWHNVTESVRVFRSSAEANASWARTNSPALVACDEQYIRQSAEHLQRTTQLSLPTSARHTAGYRIVATINRTPALGRSGDLLVPVYNDVLLIASGKAQVLVVFNALVAPFSRSFEERIARGLVKKLNSGPRAP